MRNLLVTGRLYLLAILLMCVSSISAQQVTGASSPLTVNPGNFTIIDPSLQVAGSGNITDFTVQIVGNYYLGDELSFDGGLAGSLGITGSYTTMSGVTGILNFSGTASPESWQQLLRTVTFRNTTAECGPGNRQIQFMSGRYLYNQFNGHYYEYVSDNLNWKQAKDAAAGRSYNGLQGYLATSSSQAENNFIWKLMASDAWVGSTYDYDELVAAGVTAYANQAAAIGKVYWVTGPEKGTFVSSGLGSPVAQNGQYMNWNPGEPNNYSNTAEYYTQLYSSQQGRWNDLPIGSQLPYLVEYGGMPGDIPQNNNYTRRLELSNTLGGEITGGNVSVCTGSNSVTLTTTAAVPGVNIVRWEYSYDNFITPGVAISHTGATYTATNLTQTTFFRSIASGNLCSEAPSASTKITVGTTVAGNLSADNTSLCNGSGALISLTGNSGNVVKWQYSTDNNSWSDIASTSVQYHTGALPTGTYYYRVHVSNAACGTTVISSSLQITVSAASGSVSGTIAGTSVLCGLGATGTLTLSGYTGNIVKWQKSTDNGLVWSDIANTTASLSLANQTMTTLYRAVVKNGSCNTVNTSAYTVTYLGGVNTWLGTIDTDFGKLGNWSCKIPADGEDIRISTTAPFMPLLDQDRTLGRILFEDNTSLGVNGYTLTVEGDISGPSTGVLKGSATSKIVFNGYTNSQPIYFDQSVPGTSNHFANWTVNKQGVQATDPVLQCTPISSYPFIEMGISRVQLGNIDKSSDLAVNGEGYFDYTATDTTTLQQGSNYTATVTVSNYYEHFVYIWIDWNNDGDFDDANESVGSNYFDYSNSNEVTVTFTTPFIGGDITGGKKRMRIAGGYMYGTIEPCYVDYGDIEDYTIFLAPIPSPEALLVPGNKVVIGGTLTFTHGKILLGNQDMQLSNSASITGASEERYFVTDGTGRLQIQIPAGQSRTFPLGNSAYNPLSITNRNAAADIFGVKVLDEVYRDGIAGQAITTSRVQRTWDIHKQNANTGAGVDFVFNWNDGEYNLLSNPYLHHYNGVKWDRLNGSFTASSNSLTYTGYTGTFSPFAVVDYTFTLPVSWLNFTATRQGSRVDLAWSTASETNAKDYIIQHSTDGVQWNDLGQVAATGNTTQRSDYSYIHQTPAPGNNYYRVLQRDQDGKSSYSPVRTVRMTDKASAVVVLGNPVAQQINLMLTQTQSLQLLAADGRLVWQGKLNAGAQKIDVSRLAAGIYTLRSETETIRITVQH